MLNVVGVIGLSVVLEWLVDYDINQVESWSCSLVMLVEDVLVKCFGFCLFCCQDFSLLVFDFVGVYYSDMVMLLVEYGIVLWVGQYCVQLLLVELGVIGILCVFFALYNIKSDVDVLVNVVDCVLELLVD